MMIIAGLGNPGREYENTRHNAGFMALDELADRHGIDVTDRKFKGLIGKGSINGTKVVLIKPLTYMNLSGESLREAVSYFKIDPADELIVLYDDISLDPGDIRVRKRGSAGGHNGMKNIISELGTEDYCRIRVGVGEKPPRMDLKDWVLGHFTSEERDAMETAVKNAADAVETVLSHGVDEAMNTFNHKVNRTANKE